MLQSAQLKTAAGPKANTMRDWFISAMMLGPSALGGKVKFMVRPKMTAEECRTVSPTCERNTSPWSKKVVVSDQPSTDALIVRPPREKPSESIRVKGHGPAMHVNRALRNTLPSPASKDTEPTCARQRPSGEHGSCLLHGMLPVLTT